MYEAAVRDFTEASTTKALDVHHRLMTGLFLFAFHVGLTIFEWGGVRKKNSDLVVLRHFLLFTVSTICTFLVGFHIAYGSRVAKYTEEVDGVRSYNYALGLNFIENEANKSSQAGAGLNSTQDAYVPELKSFMTRVDLNQLTTNLINLTLLSSICANIAMSAISERQKLGAQILFTVLLSMVVLPIVTAWTFGQGFLQQMYLQDFGGCLSFHAVSGVAAMLACYTLKPRLGRYDPLIIKKNFEDDDNIIYLSTY